MSTIKYKMNEISKDLNIKAADIFALLKDAFNREETKSFHSVSLNEEEVSFIFDYYIQKYSSDDMKAFFDYCAEVSAKEAEKAAEKEASEIEKKKEETSKAAVNEPSEKSNISEKKEIKTSQKTSAPSASSSESSSSSSLVHSPSTSSPSAHSSSPSKKQKSTHRDKMKTLEFKPNSNFGNTVTVVNNENDESSIRSGSKVVKVIDTRIQQNVNLSKYDERLEEIAGAKGQKDYKSKHKIKSKNKKPSQSSKREDEQARLRRMEQYEKDKKKHLSNVVLPESLSVSELAAKLSMTNAEVVKKLMLLGIMASASQIIDYDTASLVAEELGATVSKEVVVTIEDRLIDDTEDKPEDLVPRSPVVVVMGHVDHGKTSLLDAIRKTNVVSGEAGGITQHIGAYTVSVNDRTITFIDTPGHAAFTAMRARGAQVTDIVILVVAGDDGIMPQTVEAINHAKAANVPIIVAVNKMDKPGADFDKTLQSLTEYGLVPEAWGGDVPCLPISAVKNEGIADLLEYVILQADILELKANPNREAKGTIIESKLDKGRGPVATVLVQNGTLHLGDVVVAGTSVGKVRVMVDDKGVRIKAAGPSTPVEIVGLSEVPDAGDIFHVVKDERMARELVEQRKHEKKEEEFKERSNISLDDLFAQIQEGNVRDLNIIIKADVQGSVEAVKSSLEKLSNDEVKVKIVHSAVGAVNESDVMLASASNAIIVGFNVRPETNAKAMAERDGVEIRLYRIIYDCIEEIEAAMKGMLAPKFKEVVLGHAEVRQTFKVSGVGTIAGCYVKQGKILRTADVRLVRDGIVIHEGKIDSLKRFKDDAREVSEGFECGIGLEKYNDIKEGDIIEAFVNEEITQ